jgi:hypothetical protein
MTTAFVGCKFWLSAWACGPPNGMKSRRFRRNSERLAGGPAADQGVRPTLAWFSTVQPTFIRLSRSRDSAVSNARELSYGRSPRRIVAAIDFSVRIVDVSAALRKMSA